MKIGVEEEFFIINPSTLFLYPAAPRIGFSLVIKERRFVDNFSMEFPHSPSALRYPFSIAELKTSPKKDIDSLKDEVIHNRGILRDACEKNGLKVLASGSHPFSDPPIHGSANCCAFHIHVSEVNLKKVYKTLRFFTGPLIALSANSPFLGGKNLYFCSRLTYSPFVGTRDFSIKRNLETVETRIFDTQITSQRAVSLAALVTTLAISASPSVHFNEIDTCRTLKEREYAIKYGFPLPDVRKKLQEILERSEALGLKEHLNLLFDQDPGSVWQLKVAEKFGLCSLLYSLFESFNKDMLCVVEGKERKISWSAVTIKEIPRETPFILAYLPFVLYTKLKTYHQKLPHEIVRWLKETLKELT